MTTGPGGEEFTEEEIREIVEGVRADIRDGTATTATERALLATLSRSRSRAEEGEALLRECRDLLVPEELFYDEDGRSAFIARIDAFLKGGGAK